MAEKLGGKRQYGVSPFVTGRPGRIQCPAAPCPPPVLPSSPSNHRYWILSLGRDPRHLMLEREPLAVIRGASRLAGPQHYKLRFRRIGVAIDRGGDGTSQEMLIRRGGDRKRCSTWVPGRGRRSKKTSSSPCPLVLDQLHPMSYDPELEPVRLRCAHGRTVESERWEVDKVVDGRGGAAAHRSDCAYWSLGGWSRWEEACR